MLRVIIILSFALAGVYSLGDYAAFAWRARRFDVAITVFALLLTGILGAVICK